MGLFDPVPSPEIQKVIDANDILINQFIKMMVGFPIWNYVPPRWIKVYRLKPWICVFRNAC
jgi:hypothetical protein